MQLIKVRDDKSGRVYRVTEETPDLYICVPLVSDGAQYSLNCPKDQAILLPDSDLKNQVKSILKVKIIACSEPAYWYSERIGEVFDVEVKTNENYDFYRTIEPIKNGATGIINISDAEVFNVADGIPSENPYNPPNLVKDFINLRDLFAGFALIALSNYKEVNTYIGEREISEAVAETAFDLAEIMLKERGRR